MYFGTEPVGVMDGVDSKVVVNMSVGTEQVDGGEVVAEDVVLHGFALFLIPCATVDDDTFLAVITHHIAVLLQHVAHKSLDSYHIGRYIIYFPSNQLSPAHSCRS